MFLAVWFFRRLFNMFANALKQRCWPDPRIFIRQGWFHMVRFTWTLTEATWFFGPANTGAGYGIQPGVLFIPSALASIWKRPLTFLVFIMPISNPVEVTPMVCSLRSSHFLWHVERGGHRQWESMIWRQLPLLPSPTKEDTSQVHGSQTSYELHAIHRTSRSGGMTVEPQCTLGNGMAWTLHHDQSSSCTSFHGIAEAKTVDMFIKGHYRPFPLPLHLIQQKRISPQIISIYGYSNPL